MPVDNALYNLGGNSTSSNYIPEEYDASVNTAQTQSIKSSIQPFKEEGISGTSEINSMANTAKTNSVSMSSIPLLEAPEVTIEDIASQAINLNAETAKLLGKESLTYSEFLNACLTKLSEGGVKLDATTNTQQGVDSNSNALKSLGLDGDGVDFLCMLLTQSSKAEMVKTIKNVLSSKVKDRMATNNELSIKNQEAATQQADNDKQRAKIKKLGIFGAIASAIMAIVAAVVTVATVGAAGPLAIAVCALAITGAVATCASSGMTIASSLGAPGTDSGIFQKLSMGLGIAGAVVSLASSGLCAFTSTVASTAIRVIGTVVNSITGVAQGGLAIASGAMEIGLAKNERTLAELRIDLEKLDKEISILTQFIEALEEDSQEFVKNILQDMEKVASLMNQVMSAQLEIAAKPS